MVDNKTFQVKQNNTPVLIKENSSLNSLKSFVASSILFLLVSVLITGAFVSLYVNSLSKRKLQDYY